MNRAIPKKTFLYAVVTVLIAAIISVSVGCAGSADTKRELATNVYILDNGDGVGLQSIFSDEFDELILQDSENLPFQVLVVERRHIAKLDMHKATIEKAWDDGWVIGVLGAQQSQIEAVATILGEKASDSGESLAPNGMIPIYAFVQGENSVNHFVHVMPAISAALSEYNGAEGVQVDPDTNQATFSVEKAQMPTETVAAVWVSEGEEDAVSAFRAWLSSEALSSGAVSAADENDLNRLVKGHTFTTVWGPYKADSKGRGSFNVVSVTTVQAVYSENDGRYYYFVVNNYQIQASGLKVWNSETDRGYYMTYANLEMILLNSNYDTMSNQIGVKSAPDTTIGSASFSSSTSYSINGTIGFDGEGGNASISGGATWEHSQSWTQPDISVENNSDIQSAKWRWKYHNLPDWETHGLFGVCLRLTGMPDVSHCNYQPEHVVIFSVPANEVDGSGTYLELGSSGWWIEYKRMWIEHDCNPVYTTDSKKHETRCSWGGHWDYYWIPNPPTTA